MSINGWTDGSIALDWLRKVFHPETEAKAGGRTRVLILDGHSSHYTLEFLQFAIGHNIVILGYPPHCTHVLQGLDVVSFAIVKLNWQDTVDLFLNMHFRGLTKEDFPYIWGGVFLVLFTEESNKKAFEVTGVWPTNWNAISSEKMKPSEVWSTKCASGLTLPSPVKRIISTMHHLSADENELVSGTRSASESTGLLTNALQSSPSGAFLIATEKVTSDQDIFAPVIIPSPTIESGPLTLSQVPLKCLKSLSPDELAAKAEELIKILSETQKQLIAAKRAIEVANAQLVVQHLQTVRLKESLSEKEKKKLDTEANEVLPDGYGKVYTAADVVECVQIRTEAKRAKEKASELHARDRARNRQAKEALDAWWKEIGQEHTVAVEVWKSTTEELRKQNIPRKKWPNKPTRPKKKSWKDFLPAGNSDLSSDEDEEDEDDDFDEHYSYRD